MSYEFHLDRARAESFGAVAESYDRLRPDFPAALLDELAMLGRTAIDVGTGTGKVARGLARRGVAVLGVEIDPAMARVARGHGIAVEIAKFETWDDAGRRFDLLTCGDAWHWLEPVAACARAARVLHPGGAFVRFFNLQVLDEAVLQTLEPVYREHAPEVYRYGSRPELDGVEIFPTVGPFVDREDRKYTWARHVTGEEWAAFVATISDHQRLPPARLRSLQAAIRVALARSGEIRVHGTTFATFCRVKP